MPDSPQHESSPAPSSASGVRSVSDFRAGDEIAGRFHLIELCGESGFGAVWKAHDRHLDREVAVKFLKTEVRSATALARFELETQVLARMKHPNVAVVFEADTTADGHPFFSMELLSNEALTTFCDRLRLPVRARLELFIAVCRGVHHAHTNGVVHRDLKPANIMLAAEAGPPTPKVIDFGIAKVVESGDFTAAGAETSGPERIGTPHYMSPEQAAARNEDITALSDVYSLGVILYELLTGTIPFSEAVVPDQLRSTRERTLHAVRTEVAAPPSLRLASAPAASVERGTSQPVTRPRLIAAVRGDLDAIVMRALARDPSRRYDSAAALADDVVRHLRHEPVLARAGGGWYRFTRWTRRHRALAAAAAVVTVAIIATAAISTRAYFIEKAALAGEASERRNAEHARDAEAEARAVAVEARNVAEEARGTAVRARGQAEDLINYMLYDLREQLEPLGRSRLLEGVSLKAAEYFDEQPAATDDDTLARNRAVMHYNRGRILLAQARIEDADAAFARAVTLMDARHTAVPADAGRRLDLARSVDGLGLARLAAGQPTSARAIFQRQLDLLSADLVSADLVSADLVSDSDSDLLRIKTHERLGDTARNSGDLPEALAHYREGESAARRMRAAHPADRAIAHALAIACGKVGTSVEREGRFADALARYAEEAGILRQLMEGARGDLVLRRQLAVSLSKAGGALIDLNRPADALAPLDAALRDTTELARIDPLNLELQRELAAAHQRLGAADRDLARFDQALEHAARDLEICEALATREQANPRDEQDRAIAGAQRALTLLARAKPADLAEARAGFTHCRELLSKLRDDGQLDAAGHNWLATVTAGLASSALPKRPPDKLKR